MKAKAGIFVGKNSPFVVREFEVTKTPLNYGRCELISSGICGTDVHFHNGKLGINTPTILGHEFVGKIVDMDKSEGEKYGLQLGDNVIADIAVPCGECLLCKNGDDANCVNMKVTNGGSIDVAPYLYGGFSEVNYTPLSNLIKIPKKLDPTMVCTFACPGPTALHAFKLAKLAGVDFKNICAAVVQGLGPVGIFAVMYLNSLGIKNIYAITAGNNAKREKLAIELGVKQVFNISKMPVEEITKELQKENNGLGVDLVFEASGAPTAVAQGFDILRNRGVYLVPGQYSNSGGVNIQPQMITFKALHIIGSSQYSMSDVKDYLEFLIANKHLHNTILQLGNKYTIKEINVAFDDAKSGNNIKTMLIK